MQMRWRVILPVIGLLLFVGETHTSYRHWRTDPPPRRYFWWSFIRLDSDPLNSHTIPEPQKFTDANGTTWELRSKTVYPGYWAIASMLSGLPAFVASALVRRALSRLGVSQVLSFMICTPILLFAWYYFLGWLLDRWRRKSPRVPVNT